MPVRCRRVAQSPSIGGYAVDRRSAPAENDTIDFWLEARDANDVTGPGTDPDSSEVMGTHIDLGGGNAVDIPQTIGGNLVCFGNLPAAHVNPADGGAPNTVGGKAIGECAGLTQ